MQCHEVSTHPNIEGRAFAGLAIRQPMGTTIGPNSAYESFVHRLDRDRSPIQGRFCSVVPSWKPVCALSGTRAPAEALAFLSPARARTLRLPDAVKDLRELGSRPCGPELFLGLLAETRETRTGVGHAQA